MTDSLTFDEFGIEQHYRNTGPLQFNAGSHTFKLQASGFNERMVWNPGRTGAHNFADLTPNDQQRFICFEPVFVSQDVLLDPGEVFDGALLTQWGDN